MESFYNAAAIIGLLVLIGIVYAGVGRAFNSMFPQRWKRPRLVGTELPEIAEGLDITLRYDLLYSGEYGGHFVERLQGVRILGYVGSGDATPGKEFLRMRWLVVEFTDGRKAYVMPHAIISLQESLSGS